MANFHALALLVLLNITNSKTTFPQLTIQVDYLEPAPKAVTTLARLLQDTHRKKQQQQHPGGSKGGGGGGGGGSKRSKQKAPSGGGGGGSLSDEAARKEAHTLLEALAFELYRDLLVLDTAHDADKYRRHERGVMQRKCPTIVTLGGDKIQSNSERGGRNSKCPDGEIKTVFGAKPPETNKDAFRRGQEECASLLKNMADLEVHLKEKDAIVARKDALEAQNQHLISRLGGEGGMQGGMGGAMGGMVNSSPMKRGTGSSSGGSSSSSRPPLAMGGCGMAAANFPAYQTDLLAQDGRRSSRRRCHSDSEESDGSDARRPSRPSKAGSSTGYRPASASQTYDDVVGDLAQTVPAVHAHNAAVVATRRAHHQEQNDRDTAAAHEQTEILASIVGTQRVDHTEALRNVDPSVLGEHRSYFLHRHP